MVVNVLDIWNHQVRVQLNQEELLVSLTALCFKASDSSTGAVMVRVLRPWSNPWGAVGAI